MTRAELEETERKQHKYRCVDDHQRPQAVFIVFWIHSRHPYACCRRSTAAILSNTQGADSRLRRARNMLLDSCPNPVALVLKLSNSCYSPRTATGTSAH